MARTDKLVHAAFQPFAVPRHGFFLGNLACKPVVLEAFFRRAVPLVTAYAVFADFTVAQARVSWTDQLVVVQRPHHLDAAGMRNFGHHRRKLRMDVVQVQHIGLEAVEQRGKLLYGFRIAKRAFERLEECGRLL